MPSPSKPVAHETGSFIGIDQSLTCFAACHIIGEKDPTPTMLVMKPKSRGARRLWELREGLAEWLSKIYAEEGIDHIVMEGYAFSRQMGHALGECGGMTKLALLDTFGPDDILAYPTIPTTQQLKMFAGLPGNAHKNLVLKAVLKKWGHDFNDDNEADAYVLAQIACSLTLGARLEYEKKTLAKLKEHSEWEPPKPLTPRRPAARRTSSG